LITRLLSVRSDNDFILSMNWKIETVGPLIFWTVMFLLCASIKFSAFDDTGAWINLAPDAALWGTGILFSLSVSDQTYSGARLISNMKRHQKGNGYSIQYEVTIPETPGFTSKYIYLFFVGMAFWIFCVLLTGHVETLISIDKDLFFWKILGLSVLSYVLAASVVGAALRALYEVAK